MASPEVSCAILARAAPAVRPALASVERATPRRTRLRVVSSPTDATRDHSARTACLQHAGRRASRACEANARRCTHPPRARRPSGLIGSKALIAGLHRRCITPNPTKREASSQAAVALQRCNVAQERHLHRYKSPALRLYAVERASMLCCVARYWKAGGCNLASPQRRPLTLQPWQGSLVARIRTGPKAARGSVARTTQGLKCGSWRWIQSARLPPRTCSASGFARCGCRSLRSALASI